MWLPTYGLCHRYGSIPVQVFADAFKFAHMVVTTFYNGVDLRDKVKILVENDTQISGGWCGGDVIAKHINGKGRIQALRIKAIVKARFGN